MYHLRWCQPVGAVVGRDLCCDCFDSYESVNTEGNFTNQLAFKELWLILISGIHLCPLLQLHQSNSSYLLVYFCY